MILSSLRIRPLPMVWQQALIGALASLSVAIIFNWVPNSEATISGSIMIVGAFIAGVIATNGSTEPDAAGFCTGLLAGVVGVSSFIVKVVTDALSSSTVAWPLFRIIFFVFVSVLFLCVAPVFRLVCGRVGGWMANTVPSLLSARTNES